MGFFSTRFYHQPVLKTNGSKKTFQDSPVFQIPKQTKYGWSDMLAKKFQPTYVFFSTNPSFTEGSRSPGRFLLALANQKQPKIWQKASISPGFAKVGWFYTTTFFCR